MSVIATREDALITIRTPCVKEILNVFIRNS